MKPTNQEISQKLLHQATVLARSGDNLYRVRAFRSAAWAVLSLPDEVSGLLESRGHTVLEQFPGIGKSLAQTIAGYIQATDERKSVSS